MGTVCTLCSETCLKFGLLCYLVNQPAWLGGNQIEGTLWQPSCQLLPWQISQPQAQSIFGVSCHLETSKRFSELKLFYYWGMIKKSAWRRPSTILTFSTGQCRPDWAFLLVDVDHPDVFYWSTLTRLSFSTGRQSTLSTPVDAVDAVDVHLTDVFITPYYCDQKDCCFCFISNIKLVNWFKKN